ncbi:MAG TPA: HEAT repeat domain-containing protein, partial [Spirochaetales bacterium]|nr:HEAT repeat domain-containing protein [Spirochaetales bacterium]
GKLGDAQAVPILVKASTADDPNVRAYAIEALGRFPGGDVSSAILSSLRDAHVLPRTAAVKAAGALGLSDAVPALEYKASYDPERQVREAAIDALARIGGGRAFSFIAGMLEDAKAASMYRAKALAVIVTSGDASSRKRAMDVFDKAALDKDRNLFQALARAVLVLDGTEAAAYAERLLADSDYTSRLAALAWVERNKYKGLAGVVKNLSETDPVPAVKKRAAETLGRLN